MIVISWSIDLTATMADCKFVQESTTGLGFAAKKHQMFKCMRSPKIIVNRCFCNATRFFNKCHFATGKKRLKKKTYLCTKSLELLHFHKDYEKLSGHSFHAGKHFVHKLAILPFWVVAACDSLSRWWGSAYAHTHPGKIPRTFSPKSCAFKTPTSWQALWCYRESKMNMF